MARTNNLTNFLNDVATAIKTKLGDNTPIPASQFDTKIGEIETGGIYQSKTVNVVTNGSQTITPDTGYDALSSVLINVQVPIPSLQTKNYEFTQNTHIVLSPEQGYDGFSSIDLTINVQGSQINNQDKTITQNGSYTADSGYTGLGTVTVNVSSGSGDVKLFDTVEHMQADQSPSEGDLAVVYREELTAVTEESEFDSCTFPNTVVLDEAFSGEIYSSFRAVDRSVMFDGMVDMSSSSFRFSGYGESDEIRVQYTSQDGITYTRTDGGEELVEFGTTIKYEPMEPWNDVISEFMKIGGNYFEGLYEYKQFNDKYFQLPIVDGADDTSPVPYDYDNTIIDYTEFINLAENYLFDSMNKDRYCIGKFNNKYYIIERTIKTSYDDGSVLGVIETSTKTYSLALRHNGDNIPSLIFNELDLDTYTIINTQTVTFNEVGSTYDGYKWYYNSNITMNCLPIIMDSNNGFRCSVYYNILPLNGNTRTSYFQEDLINKVPYYKYALASIQLDTTADYVYEKTFYGKNGVENGTLTTSVSNSFVDVNAEVYAKIQAQYNNMQPRILTNQDRDIDRDIRIIPSKTDGTPLLDTSNVTYMGNMFSGCSNLTSIPLLDTSNVTNMYIMFGYCSNLVTIPLLNTSNVINMSSMFERCSNLTSIPLLNTSNVTNMGNMFGYCSNLVTIPLLNTSNVTDMRGMFGGCSSLTTIPLLDTSKVTNMISMFTRCTSLTTIPLIDTSNVTNMNNMFADCTSLTTVPQLNTSSVTEMGSMFYDCSSLTTIPLIDTSSVTYMRSMFADCTSLTTVPQLNTSSVTGMYSMFDNCSALSNDSLNNILAMCTNATKVTSYKTLKGIGLTEEQANICKTLSNYSAFIAAGWTTGY